MKALFTITISTATQTQTQTYDAPINALQALSEAGIRISSPCGGRGTCGKCQILVNGEAAPACQTTLSADAAIFALPAGEVHGITQGCLPEFDRAPLLNTGYGAAIDIGTTTIACYIYSFPDGTLVKVSCCQNPQSIHGADVMTRLSYASEGHQAELSRELQNAICRLTEGFSIEKYVICGNTAMLHFLTQTDSAPLAAAPYQAKELFGKWYQNCYLTRCCGAFVGGDITAAVTASGMNTLHTCLLADIGTNGEMVLKYGNEYLCCSAPAGPCFEGAGISCGIGAVSGAISHVYLKDGQLCYDTIEHAPARGLCGTGLIDAISCLLSQGIIEENGYMEEDFLFPDSDIRLTCDDVRQFQLAKSAICSGIETLLHHTGITVEDIECFYIAGGFGSFLHPDAAAHTGLFPPLLAKKAVFLGNAAGIGASMLLLNKALLPASEGFADTAVSLSLAEDCYFNERFMENMFFT